MAVLLYDHVSYFLSSLRNLRREIDRAIEKGANVDPMCPFSSKVCPLVTAFTLQAQEQWHPSSFYLQMLMTSLRRNFGGVSEAAFGQLTTRFLDDCGFEAERKSGAVGSQALDTVSTLYQSLNDKLDADDDPNTAAYRHVLLLDPTDVEVTVGMVSAVLHH